MENLGLPSSALRTFEAALASKNQDIDGLRQKLRQHAVLLSQQKARASTEIDTLHAKLARAHRRADEMAIQHSKAVTEAREQQLIKVREPPRPHSALPAGRRVPPRAPAPRSRKSRTIWLRAASTSTRCASR